MGKTPQPKIKFERQHRYRLRRKEGRQILRIEVERDAVLNALLTSGRLSRKPTHREPIERELSLVVKQWAEGVNAEGVP
jgi:hypothetical protein